MTIEATLDRISQLTHAATIKLRVRSALNPLLWLCGISTPVCFVFAYVFDGGLRVALISLGGAPIVFSCLCYAYLMVNEPDRLQSEDYQIRKMAMEIIEEKGRPIPMAATSIEAIANPDLPQLSDPEGGPEA